MSEVRAEEEPIVDDLSTFQKVTAEVTGGCQCACHTGIGSATSCEHCWSLKVLRFHGVWRCAGCGFNVPFGNAHYCPTTVTPTVQAQP